ncbi:MAG: FliM/FliN family flagellar motor switch protein [Acidobacteria bacterium]|nr:FliM/FliN family flagellar motor switch protein [Acidobacteriota bacterium]
MTESANTPLLDELPAWLEGWEKCIQSVLSQTTGQSVVFEASAETLPNAESDLWFTVVVGGAVRGEMSLRLPAATGIRLAQKFLQETEPAPDSPTADHKEALEELFRQIAGQAATALASTAGGEVQFHLAGSGAPSWSASSNRNLHTRDEAGASISIELQISAALAGALQASHEPPAPKSSTPVLTEISPSPGTARYERLRDVILEVKLRFGSRRMVLRDVLALSAGVVVELDSNVNSPVDLLLDGRVAAQGDVVVVDGKYGLRVTAVLDSAPPS